MKKLKVLVRLCWTNCWLGVSLHVVKQSIKVLGIRLFNVDEKASTKKKFSTCKARCRRFRAKCIKEMKGLPDAIFALTPVSQKGTLVEAEASS